MSEGTEKASAWDFNILNLSGFRYFSKNMEGFQHCETSAALQL